MDQTDLIIPTLMLVMISQELESTFLNQVVERIVNQETGQLFIGLLPSQTEELYLTQKPNQVVFQRHLLLVQVKYSNVGILQFQSLSKDLKQLLVAHHSMHGVELTLNPHLVESQFLLTLMLISKLKLLNAIDPQNSPHTISNQ